MEERENERERGSFTTCTFAAKLGHDVFHNVCTLNGDCGEIPLESQLREFHEAANCSGYTLLMS